jgi:hypothetical protein
MLKFCKPVLTKVFINRSLIPKTQVFVSIAYYKNAESIVLVRQDSGLRLSLRLVASSQINLHPSVFQHTPLAALGAPFHVPQLENEVSNDPCLHVHLPLYLSTEHASKIVQCISGKSIYST